MLCTQNDDGMLKIMLTGKEKQEWWTSKRVWSKRKINLMEKSDLVVSSCLIFKRWQFLNSNWSHFESWSLPPIALNNLSFLYNILISSWNLKTFFHFQPPHKAAKSSRTLTFFIPRERATKHKNPFFPFSFAWIML